MRGLIVLLLPFALCVPVNAQARPGAAVQIYPAGQTAVVQLNLPLESRYEAGFHAGYNRTRRRDWGVHDDERGGGPGLGLSLKRFVRPESEDWFYGLRIDLWSLAIDWYDTEPECSGAASECRLSGDSRILVFQPTVEAGYRIFARGLKVDLALSFGREINVQTRGLPVGEGIILLAGASVTF